MIMGCGHEMFLISLCFFLAFAGSRTAAQEYRLTKDVVPDSYDIAFKPYLQPEDGLKQFTFEGAVNITLHAVVPNVQNITLHKDYIDILDTVLYDVNGKEIESIATDQLVYESVTDKLTIRLKTALAVHVNYTLYLKYTGQIRSGLEGVFRGSYSKDNWYAITQLQRIDARTAFPCFDEPQLKASFRMRITRPKEYTAYFNTRLIDTKTETDGRYTDYFEDSPRMSTYLVAFLVGDFVAQGDTDLKIIMNSQFTNKTVFTQEVARKTLAAYDSYTQMPYKTLGNAIMQKVGSVRSPHDGMENWGLVVYRDAILYQEPGYTDGWSHKEYTIATLVHETAHMWFGNSVTFNWWSYFWLNEAFARYYEYFLANEIYPEYELDKQFVVNQIHLIFGTDATSSSQPMTSPEESINTPAEIGYKFSGIAYAKGAAIVRMICNLMGKDNFDKAIRKYLTQNKFRSTVPDDLFLQWTNYWPAGHSVDLDQLFKDWTEQPGFPMISISITDSGHYSLKQERFLLDRQDGSDATLKYTVPITYTSNREKNFEDLTPKFYLKKTEEEHEFGDSNADEWIILNLQQSNYHRVFYEAPLLERLRKAFMAPNHSGIHSLNRAHIVDDLFTYGRIGLLDYDVVFKFMEYLSSELDYLAWHPAFKGLEIIAQRLTLAQHEKFSKYLYDILEPVYEKLDFENTKDTVLDVYNRNNVIRLLCRHHHADCNTKAQSLLQKVWGSQHKVSADFQETLYCAACRKESFYTYLTFAQNYMEAKLTSEKEKLLRVMGCTEQFMEYHYVYLLDSDVPQNLKAAAIRASYSQTPSNVMPVFESIITTLDMLAYALGSWSSTASVISDIADYFTTEDQLVMLRTFIDTKGHLFGTSVGTLQTAVKTVENNLAWSDKHLGKLFEYIDQRNGAVTAQSILSLATILAIVILNLNRICSML